MCLRLVLTLVILAGHQQQRSLAFFSEELGIYDDSIPDYEAYPDDGAILMDDIEVSMDRNAVYWRSELWSGGVIPYVIDSHYPTAVKNRILSSMHEIEHDVNTPGTSDCINFVARTNQANYIYVYPRNSSCSSKVGFAEQGRQDVSIGHGCEHKGIIMHELMHAIGFWHEQSRPDRSSYVTIDLDNVASGHKHNYDRHVWSKTLNIPYDYGSIMHYNAYEFAVDRTSPVLLPRNSVPDGVKMGQRLQYSANDVLRIQRLYQCTEDTSHIIQRVTSPDDHCDFAHGFCKFTQDTSDDFNWSVQSTRSSTGPGAGDSTGMDNYAVAKASGHYHKYARLRSKTYRARSLCVDWWFFNYQSTGKIRLLVDPEVGFGRQIVSYVDQKSKKWYHVYSSIHQADTTPYQLVFEAYVGHSDVAIDDINIYEGECQ